MIKEWKLTGVCWVHYRYCGVKDVIEERVFQCRVRVK